MKILKYLMITLILTSYINAKDLSPSFSLVASGGVTDLVLKEDKLFASTVASSVDIFNIKTNFLIKLI